MAEEIKSNNEPTRVATRTGRSVLRSFAGIYLFTWGFIFLALLWLGAVLQGLSDGPVPPLSPWFTYGGLFLVLYSWVVGVGTMQKAKIIRYPAMLLALFTLVCSLWAVAQNGLIFLSLVALSILASVYYMGFWED